MNLKILFLCMLLLSINISSATSITDESSSANISLQNAVIENSGTNIGAGIFWESATNRTPSSQMSGVGGWSTTSSIFNSLWSNNGYIGNGFLINDTGGGGFNVLHTFQQVSNGSFSIWINESDTTDELMLRLQDGANIKIIFGVQDGTFRYYNSTTKITSGSSYTANTWHNCKVVFDFMSDTAEYYFDGNLIVSGIPIYSDGDNVDTIRIVTGDGRAQISYLDDLAVFNNKTSQIKRNYTYEVGIGELKNISYNGTGNIDIYASVNDLTYDIIKTTAPSTTNYDVSGNGYKYSLFTFNMSDINDTSQISNITAGYGSVESSTLSITSSSPSTPTDSFVNESKTFDVGSNQDGNWTWFIDSVLMKSSETGTSNATYTNSTAPNGTAYNVTAKITNANGTNQTLWSWLTYKNYITSNVTYYNRSNISINLILNVSYVSPGTLQWGYNYSGTDEDHVYKWTYQNGTVIQTLTASSINETLEFMKNPGPPIGIYHIRETEETIETFIVSIAAFTVVVFAGAAVVSRRVRRGIGGFINRLRRR